MALWRVDVSEVSHRYVEAATPGEATRIVAKSLIAGMDLRASRPNRTVAKMYDEAGPIQRKQMLAAMDGLTNPRARQQSRSARRRLARLIRLDREEREWARAKQPDTRPMAAPDGLDQLLRLAEVRHIERNFSRMRDWDRHSPLHE